MPDHVRQLAENIVNRVVKRGRGISWSQAEAAAWAAMYLRRRGLRVPVTLEQATALDPRDQAAFRVLCTAWREWANEQDLARCERTVSILSSIRSGTPHTTRAVRHALGPICGWSPSGPRGVFTRRDWRQKCAGGPRR
jgi:hypothetical protein